MAKWSLVALLAAGTLVAPAPGIVRVDPVAGPSTAAGSSPPLAVVWEERRAGPPEKLSLVRVDPETLRPLPGKRVDLGSSGCVARFGGEACYSIPPWSLSPDRAFLAVARNDHHAVRSLRLVDVGRLRVAADVRVGGGPLGAVAWLAPKRVLALQDESTRIRLVVVDLGRRRVTARRNLPGRLVSLGRTPRELVLLQAPASGIGVARLAVADRSGRLRVVRLERIHAGWKDGDPEPLEQRLPGLAVDPDGRRAFVVDAAGVVAEVDLRALTVSYHQLSRPASLLSRLRNWFEPAAQAKGVNGPARSARWLGQGLLALSGADEQLFIDSRGVGQIRIQPAGLELVDTRGWTTRTLEPGATDVLRVGDLMLATGWSWDSSSNEVSAIGLAAYGVDGAERFHVLDGEQAWVAQVFGGRAYVGISRSDGRPEPLRVIELATGKVLAERSQPLPWLLLGAGSSWWD